MESSSSSKNNSTARRSGGSSGGGSVNNNGGTSSSSYYGGWQAALGSNHEAIALYRITLGIMLFIELTSRFQYLHAFYSDEGTLPTRLLQPTIDHLYKVICIHSYSGSMIYLQTLLSIQVLLAIMLVVGYKTRIASFGSWFLYLSLTLRNTWLNFILDRYFHYLLFYSIFLPLGEAWAIDAKNGKGKAGSSSISSSPSTTKTTFVTPATIAFKLLIVWLYWDAGYGKYSDPLKGWTFNAQPLPALDTYVRHTVAARYMYGLLGPTGLRCMTPTVVYAEMFLAPIALLGSYLGSKATVYNSIVLMCSLHLGIALTMRNTVLLSSVACVAWCIFLPEGVGNNIGVSSSPSSDAGGAVKAKSNGKTHNNNEGGSSRSSSFTQHHNVISALIIGAFICGSIWFELYSELCGQHTMKHIWSALLHNRWNVFVGAEEYVTWEIAPGRLVDGSIIDVWSKSNEVNWEMPGAGAPCTSTARAGRWRSFPYLAELDGDDGEALWSYLCQQWDEEHGVNDGSGNNDGKKLLRFNFFMLQADVLPNMGFSATRKRLIHSHDCLSDSNFVVKKDAKSGEYDFGSGEL